MQPGPPQPPPPYMYYAPPPPPKSGASTVIIVLACVFGGIFVIGILAAVAIPSFMKYERKHKHTEAEMNLDRMYKGLERYTIEHAALPTASPPLTPAESCCEQPGQRCQPDLTPWEDPAWLDIDFEVDELSYFQYRYQVSGDTVTMTAVGDLDCDGVPETYTLTAHYEGRNGLTRGSLQIDHPNE